LFAGVYPHMLTWESGLNDSVSLHPRPYELAGISVLACAMLLPIGAQTARWRRRSLLLAEPERDPKNAATLLYEEMTRAVGTRGCHRLPQQTPTEFAAGIKPTELRAAIAAFTLHYERARYGESAADAALLPRLLERVRQATRCSAA
jgi:hypothetical protein